MASGHHFMEYDPSQHQTPAEFKSLLQPRGGRADSTPKTPRFQNPSHDFFILFKNFQFSYYDIPTPYVYGTNGMAL